MKRKICVITGGRAEYGLLARLMQGIQKSNVMQLQVLATGMHLLPAFGSTYQEIEREGFVIDRKVESITGLDTPADIAKSMGLAMHGFADALSTLQPDLIVLLGDRYEIFAAAASALVLRIPVAHLHGGELTEGAYDDALRHSISKMSHLHFVAAEPYRQRVMQLGESPETVFLVGGLGVDRILHEPILERAALESALGFKLGKKNLLVTLHPETLGVESSATAIAQLLDALGKLEDIHLIFTLPNADNGGQMISTHIHAFVAKHRNAVAYEALGQSRYLSCLAHCDAVVGNSSSGIMEAPSFQKPTVNMGQRQHGRLRALSVIDCEVHSEAIAAAISKALSPEFARQLGESVNPYGAGGATEKIVNIIGKYPLQDLIPKTFFDWKSP